MTRRRRFNKLLAACRLVIWIWRSRRVYFPHAFNAVFLGVVLIADGSGYLNLKSTDTRFEDTSRSSTEKD